MVLSINAVTRQTIAAQMSNVNTISFLKPLSLEKFGTIKTTPSQPAERLTRRSEIVARSVCINLVYHTQDCFSQQVGIVWLHMEGIRLPTI